MAIVNTVRNMHYDFKQKLNKIDSNQNRNLKVPEIDWKLNEALNIFIKMVAEPKFNQIVGIETIQRTIDSLRPLIIESKELVVTYPQAKVYSAALPVDYMIHLSSNGLCVKGNCSDLIRTNIIQHDDIEDEFHSSSFEWRDLNILFSGNAISARTDGTFSITKVFLDYIKLPLYVHTAVDYPGGTYTLPDGETILTGFQNCELPVDTLGEIVDLAVLITTGDLLSSFQLKQAKTQITN